MTLKELRQSAQMSQTQVAAASGQRDLAVELAGRLGHRATTSLAELRRLAARIDR